MNPPRRKTPQAGIEVAHVAETPPTSAESANSRSLREALLAWCDPALVAVVRQEETRLTPHQYGQTGLPLLSEPSALANPAKAAGWMSGGSSYTTLRQAWGRLLNDLRQRLEREDLFLEGVRLAPRRGIARETLHGAWTADMLFDVERNSVTLGDDRFGAITVSRQRPASEITHPGTSPDTGAVAPPGTASGHQSEADSQSAAASASGAKAMRPRRERGRASYAPLIRQSVLDNWDAVEAHVARRAGGSPGWSELARTLHKRLVRAAGDKSPGAIPHEQTIRTRLPKIYEAILTEKGGRT
jgi:hypothetical protein